MSSHQRPTLQQALIAALFIVTASKPADACRYAEPTVWESIELMSVGELAMTLVLVAFLALLVTISVSRGRAILRAARQTRDYECRALTALYYDRAEEAVDASTQFPSSPVAAAVRASFLESASISRSTSRPLHSSKPAFQRTVIAQTIELKQRLWVLAAIAWSSPVLGLATALANSGPYSLHIPFCFGLLIAAPALWLHRGLSGEVELLLFESDRMSLSIIDQIDDQMRAIDKHKDDGALFGS